MCGYTRKDGTYVPGYDRTAPNDTKLDNWSTKGNTNPETGKPGTKDLYPENRGSASAGIVSDDSGEDRGPITNADILEMIENGVGVSEVKKIITDARSQFDTCPAALQEFKSKGVSDDVILSMVASSLAESLSAGENSKPTQPTSGTTTPSEERGPELQGFRLGMNFSKAEANAGSALKLRDELGVRRLYVSRHNSGVSSIEVEFLDNKLESIEVTYDSSVQWTSEKEFLSTARQVAFEIPGSGQISMREV